MVVIDDKYVLLDSDLVDLLIYPDIVVPQLNKLHNELSIIFNVGP